MAFLRSMKSFVPAALARPVIRFIDASSLRSQPRLIFDSKCLRLASTVNLKGILEDRHAADAYAKDHKDITELYESGEIRGGVNPGDRRAIYHLVFGLAANNVLEVGTHVGASTTYIARALKAGHLTTVDIVDVNAPDAAWKGNGLKHSPKQLIEKLGCSNVTFDNRPAETALDSDQRYDFIFLDGDHSARAVYREVHAALKLLRPDGLLLLHDFYPGGIPITQYGGAIAGPAAAADRILAEGNDLEFMPLGTLPWPTKGGGNATSLAIVARRG